MVNYPTLALGLFVFIVGVIDLYFYVTKQTGKFRKYQAMKKMWGSAGPVIHFIAYVVLPLVAGLVFIILGSTGVSIF